MSEPTKTRVVVVGGGCAALTAAYELSKNKDYEVTVYQLGWRLGGKAASGRNAAESGRIEEHGLHVWFGAYENTFRLVRDCYAYLNGLDDAMPIVSPFRRIEDAVIAQNEVGIVNRFDSGEWRTWLAHFPPTPGMPGDPISEDDNPFTLRRYVSQSLELLRSLIISMVMSPETAAVAQNDRNRERRAEESDKIKFTDMTIRLQVEKMFDLFRKGALCSAGALLEAMTLVDLASDVRFGLPGEDYLFVEFVRAVADNTRKLLETAVSADPAFRLKLDIVELLLATVVGIAREGLLANEQGLDAIEGVDWREWLARNGCSEHARNSGFVHALYGMYFADTPLRDGSKGIAAGQALRSAFRMFFTYRGALFWKLRGSMGDVMFTPLYEALKRRNVKFKFFHRLIDVAVDMDQKRVTQLTFEQQAHVAKRSDVMPAAGACAGSALQDLDPDEYYPLDGKGSWPSRPLPAQIGSAADDPTLELQTGTSVGKTVLKCDDDFDFMVLGVSVDVVKTTCSQLVKSDRRWRQMAKTCVTIATQSVQVWLEKPTEKLGWKHGPALVSGIPGPLDTWADMTHIIANERWDNTAKPQSLAYFCAALSSEEEKDVSPEAQKQRLQAFLREYAPRLWGCPPAAIPPNGIYYARVNVDASDRYVLSRPGSLRYRISPLDDSYVNLTVAGDWTSCGLNQGCVEAAVMSGLLASHALTGKPALETIIGYDHP